MQPLPTRTSFPLNINTFPSSPAATEQLPLILEVNNDDQLLEDAPGNEWYRVLKCLPLEDYRGLGADYYNALHQFNVSRKTSPRPLKRNEETKEQAAQRHLFNRPTINKDEPVIYQPEPEPINRPKVSPLSIGPGITPTRAGGRKPKCFFALFKSFLGATLMGFPPEPDDVHRLLTSNLHFARVCGFIPKEKEGPYWYREVPSLRKLEQFDQIMIEYGLWTKNKWFEVQQNIVNDFIETEHILVGDTTHYHSASGFETVEYTDDKGKDKKKSQSKMTKPCRCEDRDNCPHPWIPADDGAGTIVKGSRKIVWGHKAAIIGLPSQGIPLDAAAVVDGATFDGKTFLPHLEILFENLPEIYPWIDTVLYDSACDNQKLRDDFMDRFGIVLKTSVNPRWRKPITAERMPRGMKTLTPYGSLKCKADLKMEYQGKRDRSEKYIYQAPMDENGVSVCVECSYKSTCCPKSKGSRMVTIGFDMLPHIDSCDPPMAKRFEQIMKMRPSVERMIKRLKCDLSDDRLKKRGNASFQAYLDKTMIAFHILLRQ
ncbi:MAG: hypothetical protein GY845_02460 [Planctomycetes bacterium]|nr:hypothetical protein [Planctomycetota bacterium]